MPEDPYHQEPAIAATKATAHLPGLDIEIVHQQSANRDWEQLTISLRAMPSFEVLGQRLPTADPFTLWLQAARLMWMPWLFAAQTMMLPHAPPRMP